MEEFNGRWGNSDAASLSFVYVDTCTSPTWFSMNFPNLDDFIVTICDDFSKMEADVGVPICLSVAIFLISGVNQRTF